MFEIKVLVPTVGNDGRPFTEEEFAELESVLTEIFGGFSREAGLTVGGWKGPDGRVYRDASRVYVVFLDSITKAAEIATIVAHVKLAFAQEAVAIRYAGMSEIL